jgi:hypothetical protein
MRAACELGLMIDSSDALIGAGMSFILVASGDLEDKLEDIDGADSLG